MKTVCLFGIYDPEYSRNRVLKRAFEENGYEVTACRADPRRYRGFSKYTALIREYRALPNKDFAYVLVCFPGHSVVWLARILFGRRIVFDEFVSLYDSNVNDRRRYSRFHPRAWYDLFLDWSSAALAWRVLADTNEHIRYLSKGTNKFIRVLVGTDESVFYPRPQERQGGTYMVHFHGFYIPLQGVKHIIEAASLLKEKNILFRLIGRGQDYEAARAIAEERGLANVEFVDRVKLEELPSHIVRADACLGIFGMTEKAARVIPNKVYEYAAMGKPIITADTPAIREVFFPGADVLLCKPGSGEALAGAIEWLMARPEEAKALGEKARGLFEDRLSARALGAELLSALGQAQSR